MAADRWKRLREIFEEAAERIGDERARFLEDACAGDASLRADVDRLLAADSSPNGLTSALDADALAGVLDAGAQGLPEGARVGAFGLRRLLASGGMGTVYEATQEHPRRTVALKLMRAGSATPAALRRFEVEAEILGRLRHPGIAQVYEAATHAGVPYFAMELVEGARSILDFARERALDERARIELFLEVLDAVRHAHQRGVIHRDLKPENVLVDAAGRPKVIDFGVARLTGLDAAALTVHTQPGQLVGTIRYMSPEQLAGASEEIDTRTDVYSLGVVLYELLCGRPPYDLEGKGLTEVARVIGHEPPVRPRAAAPALARDLEWILLKALEKDPARRFGSVAELADDLRRFLADEPVLAGPPSAAYRLSKFVRRHRVGVAATAAIALVLIAGIVGTTAALVRAREAEKLAGARQKEAEDDRDRLRTVVEFVQEMISSPEPTRLGKDVKVVEALDEVEPLVATRFKDQPRLEAAIRTTMGKLYARLGYATKSEAQLRAALALNGETYGDMDRETHLSKLALAMALVTRRQLAESETLARASWNGLVACTGADSDESLAAKICVADILSRRGALAEARRLAEETLASRREISGGEHPKTLVCMSTLSKILLSQGALAEAEPLLRDALAIRRRVLGDGDPLTLVSMNSLGMFLMERGSLEESEALMREAAERQAALRGADHPQALFAMHNLAAVLRDAKKLEEAMTIVRAAAEGRERQLGAEDPLTLLSKDLLASCLAATGAYAEALEMYRRVIDAELRVMGEKDGHTLDAMASYAGVLDASGDRTQAEAWFRRAVDASARHVPAGHWRIALYQGLLGKFLAKQGRDEEAEPVLAKSLAALDASVGRENVHARTIAKTLGELYERTGRAAEAEAVRTARAPAGATPSKGR